VKASIRRKIKGFLEEFIDGIISSFVSLNLNPRELRPPVVQSASGRIRPFHEAILPHGILTISEFERSFSTRLGTTFEEVARLIAAARFPHAERSYRVTGSVSETAIVEIERIVESSSAGYLRGRFPDCVRQVLSANSGPRRELPRPPIADLRVVDSGGNETLFEIKSPKPNKGQCDEATRRLLTIYAIRGRGQPRVRAFYAMAYNPYGDDLASYDYSIANNYLDMENQVLLGPQFWEYIGGPNTYEAVLKLYREVGAAKGPEMIKRLGLGY